MKIDSGSMGMESARMYRATSVTFRKFTITDYRQEMTGDGSALGTAVGENAEGTENAENAGNPEAEKLAEQLQQSAADFQNWQNRMRTGSKASVRSSAGQTYASIRHTTIRYIFDLLFSARRERWRRWLQGNGTESYGLQSASGQGNQESGSDYTGQIQKGSGREVKGGASGLKVFNYTSAVIETEKESTAFSTTGTVRTSDGREINFNVNVGMSREFQQYYERNMTLGTFTMCDPLVINLDTELAELSDQTFFFDIDGDGEKDKISQLGTGSGYLALDRNGDGIINDGSELFGTASGDGFADLAKYDEDGNGWIDENDAIWSKLKIWCKNEDGNDVLYRLADKGVGAICLKNVSTDFTMKGQEGQTRGAVRSTGIFLYENGGAGTVQHVDVAKYSAKA